MNIVSSIIWSVVSYFIVAESTKDNQYNINPINYSLLTFFFGFMFSMGVLMIKLGNYKEKSGLKITGILLVAFGIIVNIIALGILL